VPLGFNVKSKVFLLNEKYSSSSVTHFWSEAGTFVGLAFLLSKNNTEKITPCEPVISNMPSGEEIIAESNSCMKIIY
jgi:hypothetical protein